MKKIILITLAGILVLLSGCSTKDSNDSVMEVKGPAGWNCIRSFDDFLYQMTEISRVDSRYSLSDVYPSQPWELVAEIPESFLSTSNPGIYRRGNLELARTLSGQTALWIRVGRDLLRYAVATDDFLVISASPSDEHGKIYNDVQVNEIFQMAPGKIAGINYSLTPDVAWPEPVPLFSVFNENNEKFEFYDIGLKYYAHYLDYRYIGMIPRKGLIISKGGNIFWIYQQQDGLYSYNPLNLELRHYETSFDGIVQRMILAPDGSILFSQKKSESWELQPGELVRFDPASRVTTEISVPFFRWPDYGTLLYTTSGDLWIGIQGYRTKDGNWVLKNPNRLAYINLGWSSKSYNWVNPKLIFQSSNGYLWYTNEKGDGLGVDGAAWYDPSTAVGCWFTTETGNIVEDDQKNLWMVAGKKIYRYALP